MPANIPFLRPGVGLFVPARALRFCADRGNQQNLFQKVPVWPGQYSPADRGCTSFARFCSICNRQDCELHGLLRHDGKNEWQQRFDLVFAACLMKFVTCSTLDNLIYNILLTIITNYNNKYKYSRFDFLPRTAAAAPAREAVAIARARRRPAGSPRSRSNRPQTDAGL